jgi:ElaA protein
MGSTNEGEFNMELIVKHFDELSTRELYEILKTRAEIFVVEQDCVYQDLDDKDQDAIHVFCWNDKGRVAGCLRVFMKDEDNKVAQIGRVVTLEHGKGLGGKLLRKGVEVAESSFGANSIYLEAQKYAIGYYAKEGFEVVSDEFLEDGIPHVKMERRMQARG